MAADWRNGMQISPSLVVPILLEYLSVKGLYSITIYSIPELSICHTKMVILIPGI